MSDHPEFNLPFTGQWLVMNGGDTEDINHHHANKAQHYAFDFVNINKDGRTFTGEGTKNEDYYSFDQPVLAPANGIVVEAIDGVRDNKPGQGNYLSAAGNHLIIEHAENLYSFIAHLKQDSLTVKRGDSVQTSQHLARSGNSGQSFAPHLHFHIQDSVLLDQYEVAYHDVDARKAPFPTLTVAGYIAKAIKIQFVDILLHNTEAKSLYSPVRGDVISTQRD